MVKYFKLGFKYLLLPILIFGLFFVFQIGLATDQSLNITMTTCGDGVVQSGEECDLTDLDSKTCSNYGFNTGSLSCNSSCVLVTSGCSNGPGGCTGDCSAPSVSGISISSIGSFTAVATWVATDDVSVANTTFWYGIGDFSSSSPGVVVGDPADHRYQVSLTGLQPVSNYSYKITASDPTNNQVSTNPATFTTLEILNDAPPDFLSVTSNTLSNAATVFWQVSDTSGSPVSLVSFSYGLTTDYGIPESLTVTSSGIYSKNIIGLSSNQTYYFKITASDSVNPSVNYFGSFKTQGTIPTGPTITSFNAVPGISSCQINWQTDQSTRGLISYGLSNLYGSSSTDDNLSVNHSLSLFGLSPSTTYHYRITATNGDGYSTSTLDNFFVTGKDTTAPSDISGLTLNTLNDNFELNWTNPPGSGSDADFAGVKVIRKIGSRSTSISDGELLFTGGVYDNTYTDSSFTKNTRYFFTVFSFDTSLNYSSGLSIEGIINRNPLSNVSNLTAITTADKKIKLTWVNPQKINDDVYFLGVKIVRKVGSSSVDLNDGELVYTGSSISFTDENISRNTNYYYKVFSYDSLGRYSSGEAVNHSVPSDIPCKDRCSDLDCKTDPACVVVEDCNSNCSLAGCCTNPICVNSDVCKVTLREICGNGLDDDNNNLIDCKDPTCFGLVECKSITTDTSTPPGGTTELKKISLGDLSFLSNDKIILVSVDNAVTGMAGTSLTVLLRPEALPTLPVNVSFKLGNDEHVMTADKNLNKYYSKIFFPHIGVSQAYIIINYGTLGTDVFNFKINSLPYGNVMDGDGKRLEGVQIFLYKKDGELMDLGNYFQSNPVRTDVNGVYGWMVPNGEYYLLAKKNEFHDRQTMSFLVNNNVVNQQINLIKIPPKLEDIIDPEASITQNVANVAVNLAQKTKAGAQIAVQKVEDVKNNPEIQKASRTVVAPAVTGVVAVSTFSFISFADVLPFLRLFFLQPLLLLGKRKREKWGQVYNALDKQPVDLAIVRLIDAETGKISQSKVTDKMGRYAFVAEPGKYKIEVQRTKFIFPSALLTSFKSDGRRVDIYHGEEIEVTENNSVITVNIPLDIEGGTEKPRRLLWNKIGRVIQISLSRLGLVITIISLYISPKWYVWALLAVHILLTLIFHRLSKPLKVKGWGIVYDAKDKKPVGQAVARLFNAEFNKLVSSQMTDRKGRYYFLAGDNKYYVTIEHEKYNSQKTSTIDLSGKDSDAIAVDVAMDNKNADLGSKPEANEEIISNKSTPGELNDLTNPETSPNNNVKKD